MATSVMSRFSYPKVPGDSPWSILDVTGPASYTPVTVGFDMSAGKIIVQGGQQITAADFGLQSLDFVAAMANNFGTQVLVVPTPFVTPETTGSPMDKVTLNWVGSGDGSNLSTAVVRLLAIGR